MDVHFSHHCGENIELSEEKQKASWNHKYSGGIAFSSQPLRPNSKLKLDLTGTGHAYVGIIKRDPASVPNMRKALTSDVIVATEVKVHKRLGAVNIVSDTKEGKDCIRFESYNGTKTVDINSEVWLFLYIKFGDMIAVLHSETIHDRCFHHVTGCNIRCLDEDRRSVKLLVENPAAVLVPSGKRVSQIITMKAKNEEKDYDYVRPEVEISETIKKKLQISDKQHEKESSSSDRSSSDSDYLEMKDVSDSHKTFSPNCKNKSSAHKVWHVQKDHSSSNVQECK
ncbi:unnamed protein product [Mytilus edulis]|uniref:NHR domain-containing protein n=1 Tax=Mytilus edulis TaxID=6550 RepID=A0A8S3SAT3_MYTED|nr:unnamed protein product [Mytilus edulis]